jgi:hypothetical protein
MPCLLLLCVLCARRDLRVSRIEKGRKEKGLRKEKGAAGRALTQAPSGSDARCCWLLARSLMASRSRRSSAAALPSPRQRSGTASDGAAAAAAAAAAAGGGISMRGGGGRRRSSAVGPGAMGLRGSSSVDPTSDLQTFNIFDRLLNESLKKSFFLGDDSYFMFWHCLSDPRLAIQFVTQLIEGAVQMTELIRSKKLPPAPTKKQQHSLASPLTELAESLLGGADNSQIRSSMQAARSAMVSTVVFIATNFDIKTTSASADDQPMFQAIAKWKRQSAQKGTGDSYEKASQHYSQLACALVEDLVSASNEVDVMEALETVVQLENIPCLAVPFRCVWPMPSYLSRANFRP